MAEIESADCCPCRRCPHSEGCAVATIACRGYVKYAQTGRRADPEWPPTRLNYLMAHSDLQVSRTTADLAKLLREFRDTMHRRPTLDEATARLGLDERAVLELAARYQHKQGMTGEIFRELRDFA